MQRLVSMRRLNTVLVIFVSLVMSSQLSAGETTEPRVEPGESDKQIESPDGEAEIQVIDDAPAAAAGTENTPGDESESRESDEESNGDVEKGQDSDPHDGHWWLQLLVQIVGIGVVLVVIAKAHKANRISMKAVEAAEGSIEVARDIGNKQLRAYLHVEKIGIDPASAQRPVINYKVRNFGQTPAQNIVMKQAMSIGAFPLTTELYEELLAAAVDQGERICLGPGDIIGTSLSPKPTPLTDAEITQVQAGTMALYMLVEHEYEDMFGERHFSRICAYTNGIGYGVSPDMHAAKMGNEIG